MLITRADTFDAICRTFTWQLPERMNIAALVCDRHATRAPDSIALLHEQPDGRVATFTFGAVQHLANQCAHTFEQRLRAGGGGRRDHATPPFPVHDAVCLAIRAAARWWVPVVAGCVY